MNAIKLFSLLLVLALNESCIKEQSSEKSSSLDSEAQFQKGNGNSGGRQKNSLPSISLSGPSSGTVLQAPASFNLKAIASDRDGSIVSIELYQNSNLVSTSSSSYLSLDLANLPAGSYNFYALATDNLGGSKASSIVYVIVETGATINQPPSVHLSAPANYSSYPEPAEFSLVASALDSDGSISAVEFYQDSTLLVRDTVTPFSFNISGLPVGSYVFTAKAIDNLGASKTSEPIYVTVKSSQVDPNYPPVPVTELIPAVRLTEWIPGKSVGVPGGIRARSRIVDVTLSPYYADKTGTNDASVAINNAIASANDEDVIYLPAGKYLISEGEIYPYGNQRKNRLTIRGAGMDKTILDCRVGTCIKVGTGVDYLWSYPSTGNIVSNGKQKGSTTVSIADTSAFSVGMIIELKASNNYLLPVISPGGGEDLRRQLTKVTAKSATSLTFYPPLHMDLSDVKVQVKTATQQVEYFGVEDLTINNFGGRSFSFGILIEQSYGSWVKGVKILGTNNYGIFFMNSLNCEIRESYMGPGKHGIAPNGAGILMNEVTGCLVEDNIVVENFPGIEINFGSTGNVFAYNFVNHSTGLIGIDTNHGPHNSYNLFEGNISNNIMSDGYFGSESEGTVYRNWLTGVGLGDNGVKTPTYCLSLKRLTRNYSVIANIMGSGGNGDCDSYGQPNIGNGNWSGEVQPSKGIYWADWNPISGTSIKGTIKELFDVNGWDGLCKNCGATIVLSSGKLNFDSIPNFDQGLTAVVRTVNGNTYTIDTSPWSRPITLPVNTNLTAWPGPGGFQELDLDVKATTLLKANYRHAQGIPASEAIGTTVLPDSLYRSAKPAFFKSLAWPPFDPRAPKMNYEGIPAAYRYKYGVNPN